MSVRPPSAWVFPPLEELAPGDDLIAVGADLEPETLLDAYEAGYFPMPVGRRRIGWFSPDPRGILEPNNLHVSRSLRRSLGRFDVTVDQNFGEVIRACADPSRPHGWIDRRVIDAYTRLHHLGHAHSVEVWDRYGLAGGLYGIAIGGFFAGESMFHRHTDASKVALVHLVNLLGDRPGTLIDVQWSTPHLASLGVTEIGRHDYAARLRAAVELPPSQVLDPNRSSGDNRV
ncbi:MAG: leucyl/phenylalanyl-tRNA--protein transferase [Acidimicrobiales bacterium]|jgi:leucyl/phenylalanyl-tRNA---protein transferase